MDEVLRDDDIFIEQSFSTGYPVRLRDIRCESCGHVFLCERAAEEGAWNESTRVDPKGKIWVEYSELARWVDRVYGGPVPCPKCNRLQSGMVEGLRVFHASKANHTCQYLKTFGIGLLVLGILLAVLRVAGIAKDFIDWILPSVASLGGMVLLLFTIPFRRERQRVAKLDWRAPEFQGAIEAGRSRCRATSDFLPEFRARLNQIAFALRENPPGTNVAALNAEQARLMQIVASAESPAGEAGLKPWKRAGEIEPQKDS